MENNIVYDLIMLESDRIVSRRMKQLDLYYKDAYGNFEKLGEAYDKSVEELVAMALKKKKMRYVITFVDALDVQNDLNPSSIKILRMFGKVMTYGNIVKGYGFVDIHNETKINTHFITKAINQLLQKDIIRLQIVKGRRIYMVNPIMFYKGSMKKIFGVIKKYDEFPKYQGKKPKAEEQKKTIF